MLALISSGLLCLSSCTTVCIDNNNYMPPWAVAGPEVARELEKVPYEGYEHFWNWLGGPLDKHRQIILDSQNH